MTESIITLLFAAIALVFTARVQGRVSLGRCLVYLLVVSSACAGQCNLLMKMIGPRFSSEDAAWETISDHELKSQIFPSKKFVAEMSLKKEKAAL